MLCLQVSNLQYRLENVDAEKQELQQEVDTLREHVDQLQQDCDRYLEEKRNYYADRAALESQLKILKQKESELDKKVRVAWCSFTLL